MSDHDDGERRPNRVIRSSGLPNFGFSEQFVFSNGIVRCINCGAQTYSDDPEEGHSTFSFLCDFILGHRCVLSAGVPNFGILFRQAEEKSDLSDLGVCYRAEPMFPRYRDEAVRSKSFAKWPVALRTTARSLWTAGFFYRGEGDETLCFQCGLGLREWRDEDDPWVEHAKFAPRCGYLLSAKGLAFVNRVKEDVVAAAAAASTAAAAASAESEPPSSTTTDDNDDDGASLAGAKELCKVCYKTEVSNVFLPCAHLVTCLSCATNLTDCPMCRCGIKATLRVFF